MIGMGGLGSTLVANRQFFLSSPLHLFMGVPFVSLPLFRGFLLLLLHPFWAAAAGARLECQIAFVISASVQEESSDCFMLGWTLVHVSFSFCYKISEVGLGTGALEISLFPFSFVFDTMIFFPCWICENCSCGFFFSFPVFIARGWRNWEMGSLGNIQLQVQVMTRRGLYLASR